MTRFVLDTDMLSLWQHGHPSVCRNVAAQPVTDLAITVITVQEQLDGWHSRLPRAKDRQQLADLYQRLANTVRFLSRLEILSFSIAAIDRYEQLRQQKLNIGKMDLRIAATVLELGCALVTRNSGDLSRVPGLQIVDWSK